MNTTANRRLHPRTQLRGVAATVQLEGSSLRKRRRVSLIDLSPDGVSWRPSQPLEPGTRVRVSFRTGRVFGRTLRLDAVVIRNHARIIAAQFLAVEDRARLEAYLRAQAKAHVAAPSSSPAPFDAVAAFRVLAAGLEQAKEGEPRLVVVASPRPADGKSFVAAGIASHLAAMGRQILLVDADLQAPTQHLRFMGRGAPGLAQLLADANPKRAAAMVQPTASGVSLIAAGAAGVVPGISQESAARITAVLRGLGFPIVIIDCPPILTSPETLLLIRSTDYTLLTVRSGVTRERDMRQALELLQRQGTPADGLVLNDYKDGLGGSHPPTSDTYLSASQVSEPIAAPTASEAVLGSAPGRDKTPRLEVSTPVPAVRVMG
jgi:Mrp family chromosome partitioning ATPase